MSHRSEPTDEQLERAWRELAKPEWGTLADARAAANRFAVVRGLASARANGRSVTMAPAPGPAAAPAVSTPSHATWGSLRVSHQEPIFDRKRAASGEREDD